ncbi:MAG: hypothetical protein KGO96_02035 [Elusimicrobia bacterium]|nr:hypothetical protein [Elusimicrobiota bacterium]MDE2237155.1 hypothetical protein [Elusimicrobiota bacterium]MDE2424675.1 hypothetical protein [Elusimicrobiota bacterium]
MSRLAPFSLAVLLAAPAYPAAARQPFQTIIAAVKPLGPSLPGSHPSAGQAFEVDCANGLRLSSDPSRAQVRVRFPSGASLTLSSTTLEVLSHSIVLSGRQDYVDSYGLPRRRELRQVVQDQAALRPPEYPRLISTDLWLMSLQELDEALDADGTVLDSRRGPPVVVSLRGEADTWGERGAVRESSSGDYRLFSGDLIVPLLYRRWLVSPQPTPATGVVGGPAARRLAAALRSRPF